MCTSVHILYVNFLLDTKEYRKKCLQAIRETVSDFYAQYNICTDGDWAGGLDRKKSCTVQYTIYFFLTPKSHLIMIIKMTIFHFIETAYFLYLPSVRQQKYSSFHDLHVNFMTVLAEQT